METQALCTGGFYMNSFRQELMYEFHAGQLVQTEALRQLADQAVKEIKDLAGWDTDVQVSIGPEAKDKRLFSVSLNVFGLREPIIVKKEGKHVLAVMRKVRKAVLRQIHKVNGKRMSYRRKQILREQFAS
jgi:hypothetical protein